MNPVRKQSLKFFAFALVAAIVMFLLIFVGHLDHYFAVGGAIIALIMFFVLFNHAWVLWERAGSLGATSTAAVDG